jgi:cysteinyl-tRNA synthetase
MAFKLYNTFSRKLEVFKPLKQKEVRMYTCGPTVYNFAHIGNFRAYVAADLLKRYLEYQDYKVLHVMNITDVDDKTIKNSIQQGLSLQKYTKKYTDAFFEDLEELNIEKAKYYPRATDHIKEMVAIIKKLMKKDLAYKGEDGCIYFSVSKFKNYGKLARLKLDTLESGARVKQDEYDKESLSDFALWKAWDKEDGDVFWETDIGKGRPGWHIECSAMSTKYLGDSFDIHTGGADLVFPHHENEIAQTEGATGKKFVNYWVHNEWLLVDGKKMSKSLGNFYTLRDILEKGYSGKEVKYLLLNTHYRQQANFTFKELDAAKTALGRLNEFVLNVQNVKLGEDNKKVDKMLTDVKKCFESEMDNDLAISGALSCLFNFVRDVNALIADNKVSKKNAKDVLKFMKNIDSVLGVMDFEIDEVPKGILDMVNKREKARKDKNFEESDKFRDLIKEKGYQIDDTNEGPRVKKI